KHNTQAPNVRPRIHVLTARLFRRHIADSAQHRPRICLHFGCRIQIWLLSSGEFVAELCDPKIQDLNVTIPPDHDVLGLDVAMDDAGSVSSTESRSEDRKSTRLNSSHLVISYAVFCLK